MKSHVWKGSTPIPCSSDDCDNKILIGDPCFQIGRSGKKRYVCQKCGERMQH